ncbi:MAG: di-heme oxidoredictase family protein [Blastocatellia bacterium]
MHSQEAQEKPVSKSLKLKYAVCTLFILACAGVLSAQSTVKDPGPRPGPAGAGGPFAGLNANEKAVFAGAKDNFQEVDSVSGTIEAGHGLGPTFNGNSCAQCHSQPDVGGTSPAPFSPQVPQPNPQVALAKLDGATNTVPSFITANGPVREARFILNPDGTLDGGVHDLYTIKGRTDALGCNEAQPNFAQQIANFNLINRIPTPLFGLGLIENTPDATLQANLAANASAKNSLGIKGRFNTSGNDGTITSFGWKAQNKSLLIFAGEAYNVEMGVSNENFPNERAVVPGCVFNPTPEDSTNGFDGSTGTTTQIDADIVNFAIFMRLTNPPTPTTASASELNGQALFGSIGCTLCHTPSLTTAASPFTGMGNFTYHPYSDVALHHMGSTLADGVMQGGAGPDEFRTAPLWGVGQRLFFLHDGRTSDLLTAIEDHASNGNDCVQTTLNDAEQFEIVFQVQGVEATYTPNDATDNFCGSEANGVINNFNRLSPSQRQDILNFLRSL